MSYEDIKKFVDNYNIKPLIVTPCYGGQVFLGYMNSVLRLVSLFTKIGIPFDIFNFGGESLITRARNTAIARFMNTDCSHLIFIDADITFKTEDIINLLLSKKEIIGGVYPKKGLNYEKMKKHINNTTNLNDLLLKSSDMAFNPLLDENNKILYEKDLIRCKNIPTGFMCLARSLLESIILKYNEYKYTNNISGYDSICNKDCFIDLFQVGKDENNIYLSEDYFFCNLVIKMGINIYADPQIQLSHTGNMDFIGCLDIQDDLLLDQDTKVLL
jgi:hypothetical protein